MSWKLTKNGQNLVRKSPKILPKFGVNKNGAKNWLKVGQNLVGNSPNIKYVLNIGQ